MSEVLLVDGGLNAGPALVAEADSSGFEVSEKIAAFLAAFPGDTPALVIDLEAVEAAYVGLAGAMAPATIYYAVKANPAPEVVRVLANQDACFDVASRGEIDLCLAQGISADRLSYGNPLKKAADIAYAYDMGVPSFAFDSLAELEKLAIHAPGAQVLCRIAVKSEGADWPLARKFGCPTKRALPLLLRARALGLNPAGLSFHVGSQQMDLAPWDMALNAAKDIFVAAQGEGLSLTHLNLGGGVPAVTRDLVPNAPAYAARVMERVYHHFGDNLPELMVEPGRALVADAGVIASEVVLVTAPEDREDNRTWVYLDIGRYSGLAETLDEAIRYPILTNRDGDASARVPVVLAGPSCDSTDTLYDKANYHLPESLQAGDRVLILSTGAYTASYASVGFNGFEPLKTFCI